MASKIFNDALGRARAVPRRLTDADAVPIGADFAPLPVGTHPSPLRIPFGREGAKVLHVTLQLEFADTLEVKRFETPSDPGSRFQIGVAPIPDEELTAIVGVDDSEAFLAAKMIVEFTSLLANDLKVTVGRLESVEEHVFNAPRLGVSYRKELVFSRANPGVVYVFVAAQTVISRLLIEPAGRIPAPLDGA